MKVAIPRRVIPYSALPHPSSCSTPKPRSIIDLTYSPVLLMLGILLRVATVNPQGQVHDGFFRYCPKGKCRKP